MLKFTEMARDRVLSFIRDEGGSGLALRVAVRPGSPFAPDYDLSLVEEWESAPGDAVIDAGGFKVLVDPDSSETLDGATIDWVEGLDGGGFKVENPNIKPIGAEPPSGPLAERVKHVIDQRINPGVAMHGGHVELVDVRDETIFVELSGGCQGCGMARVTLKQGIERMVREMIPEIVDVVDVTDHTAGTNPYFQSAK